MTGFGEARHQDPRGLILVEVRAVNHRYFKFSARLSESCAALEPALERLVRERVKRGSIQLNLKLELPRRPEDYRLNLVALASYRDQLKQLPGFDESPLGLAQLLALPGVVENVGAPLAAAEEDWPGIERVVNVALEALENSRAGEGRAMATELLALGQAIEAELAEIGQRGPQVVESYHKRLTERVKHLVHEHGVTVEPKELAREVAILADRCDISEEIVRLRSHLSQYRSLLGATETSGRKLEFLTQEIGREINTIGSKANDVQISRSVVEVKAVLEKIRELIQNVA
jgi:uncharacterized protein (TIGR00255 family)